MNSINQSPDIHIDLSIIQPRETQYEKTHKYHPFAAVAKRLISQIFAFVVVSIFADFTGVHVKAVLAGVRAVDSEVFGDRSVEG